MPIDLHPELRGELVVLSPLQPNDFGDLYAVASDPLVWEQHPNRERYKRDVFRVFFEGAPASTEIWQIRLLSLLSEKC